MGRTQRPVDSSLTYGDRQKHPETHCNVQTVGFGFLQVGAQALPHCRYSIRGSGQTVNDMDESYDKSELGQNLTNGRLTIRLRLTLVRLDTSFVQVKNKTRLALTTSDTLLGAWSWSWLVTSWLTGCATSFELGVWIVRTIYQISSV